MNFSNKFSRLEEFATGKDDDVRHWRVEVGYFEGGYRILQDLLSDGDYFEVIGNIYQNPELIKIV